MGQQTDALRPHLSLNLWRICHIFAWPHMLCAIFQQNFSYLAESKLHDKINMSLSKANKSSVYNWQQSYPEESRYDQMQPK